jgi:hypothetical protein
MAVAQGTSTVNARGGMNMREKEGTLKLETLEMRPLSHEELQLVSGGRCSQVPTNDEQNGICIMDTVCHP